MSCLVSRTWPRIHVIPASLVQRLRMASFRKPAGGSPLTIRIGPPPEKTGPPDILVMNSEMPPSGPRAVPTTPINAPPASRPFPIGPSSPAGASGRPNNVFSGAGIVKSECV